jgi:DNA-binding transcriptional LysR family regulator
MRWVNLIFAAVVANDLECGGLLFDRSGGRIAMTAGGQALLPYADKLKIISEATLVAVPSTLGKTVGQLAEIATLSLG